MTLALRFRCIHLCLVPYERHVLIRVLAVQAASGLKDLTGSTSREVLMNRWRNPSLSILGIESGAVGWSTIPKGCSARVSAQLLDFDLFAFVHHRDPPCPLQLPVEVLEGFVLKRRGSQALGSRLVESDGVPLKSGLSRGRFAIYFKL